MDNPHQGNKPPKPTRVGGPHSGRRKPDVDDTDEQLREHRSQRAPSLEEVARRVEGQTGAAPCLDRDARPPRLESRVGDGGAVVTLEREDSGNRGAEERVFWHVRSKDEPLLEAEPDFEHALAAFLEACDSRA